uniref:Uncharacterized protein n=1 Tax=Glossina pallidipes TaxID=7398 RepID=A0A1A9ZET6_GLOPL
MDKHPDKMHSDDIPYEMGGNRGGGVGDRSVPKPAVRKRRLRQTAVEPNDTSPDVSPTMDIDETNAADETASTVTRTVIKTIKKTTKEVVRSTSSSTEYLLDSGAPAWNRTPTSTSPHRLRDKVAMYEKACSSGGGGMKRSTEHISDERTSRSHTPQRMFDFTDLESQRKDENPFEMDVYDIEKRLREERQRGLAEAEGAKLAFQQVQLKATPQPKPRKVEIHEEHTPSPFNVTLKTTSKISPGAVSGRIELDEQSNSPFNVTLRTTQRYRRAPPHLEEISSSPFNVTLRTTNRHSSLSPTSPNRIDPKLSTARFLEGEKTVREIHAADGVKTIVTSSMTTDGRSHVEKIFRHGEGYLSPRSSPHREFHRGVTPQRVIDVTAANPRILIKLDETDEQTKDHKESIDMTDYIQPADIGSVAPETSTGNIDITVGSKQSYNNNNLMFVETKHPVMPWQTETYTTTTTEKTTTQIKTLNRTQNENSIPEDNVSYTKTATPQSTKSPVKQKFETNEPDVLAKEDIIVKKLYKRVGYDCCALHKDTTGGGGPVKTKKLSSATSEITDDSDTEGTAPSSIVIVPVQASALNASVSASVSASASASASASPTKITGLKLVSELVTSPSSGTLSKGLSPSQTQQAQSINNDYQEFQSTMAAIQFNRSNSQYDSHIKEKRGLVSYSPTVAANSFRKSSYRLDVKHQQYRSERLGFSVRSNSNFGNFQKPLAISECPPNGAPAHGITLVTGFYHANGRINSSYPQTLMKAEKSQFPRKDLEYPQPFACDFDHTSLLRFSYVISNYSNFND